MTRAEFDEGIVILGATFPSLDPSQATLDVWYGRLSHLPVNIYQLSITLICDNEPQWWDNMNLIGCVNKYKPEAEAIVKRKMESMPKPKRLIESCPPEIARENIRKIKEMIEGIGDAKSIN